jgi:predicted acetyltransferase
VADGARSGFALLRREETGEMEVAEFYIRPTFRRGGVGLAFARELLANYPGPWLISEYRANAAAVRFWREVVEPYAFTEEAYIGDSGKPRLLQRVTVTKG